MADVQEIISKIEHGFTLYNPFYEHNYRLTVNKLENEFTKSVALENRDFAKAFRRYTGLVKAPVDFIMHITKNALQYEKMRSSVDSVRRSLGTEHTVAWCYDPKTEICILYTSVYHDTADWDEPVKVRYGLLLQWKNFKLGKVDKVEIGSGKRTSLFDANCLFTSNTMKYTIKRASFKLTDHVDRCTFGQRTRTLMLDELCTMANYSPAANFLKHHTRDYQGVDSMFMEALLKERETALKYISMEDVTNVSKALLAAMDLVIKNVDGKFHSEQEFISQCINLKYAIIYGSSTSLYYSFWSSVTEKWYFLEVNDTKRVVALYVGNPKQDLSEIVKIKIIDIVPLVKEITE